MAVQGSFYKPAGLTQRPIPAVRTLAGNTNNLAMIPAEIDIRMLYFNTGGSNRDLTGVVPQPVAAGFVQVLTIYNEGPNDLTLQNLDGASAAANRFSMGGDHTLAVGQFTFLIYSGGFWRREV